MKNHETKKVGNTMLIIQPIGGLCNRMRAINSAHMLAKERNERLIVLWNNNHELGCPFEDLFQTSTQMQVVNIHSKWNLQKLWWQFTCQFLSNDDIRANKEDGLLLQDYRSLLKKRIYIATEEHFYPNPSFELFVPTPFMQSKIDALSSKFGTHCVGIHIRRTDNQPAIGKSSTQAFIDAMNKELERNPATMFYLATDDLSEETRLRTLFPDKILSNQERDLSRNSVQGIQDALLDLYCLANTTKIIGSFFSSFTDIASAIHQIPKQIAGDV